MFNISFGCCRHNVSNIFVQLTEGRSARDQPKQPPAKKKPPPLPLIVPAVVLIIKVKVLIKVKVVACRHVRRLLLGAAFDLQPSLRAVTVPPTILVPPMLMDAVDHLVHCCLLALSLLLQVAFLPSQARYSSLWCLFVVSSLPFRGRGGLRGASLWHIVRPVFHCTNAPRSDSQGLSPMVGWPVTGHLLPLITLFQKPMRWKHAGQIGATLPSFVASTTAHKK